MKMLIGLIALALSFTTLASSGESRTFTYDGTQSSIQFLLRGEKTHTEYRYEDRVSTCYRTEIVGYRTICRVNGPQNPRGPRYPQQCHQQPIYRQYAYSCIEVVRIAYEVKDYDVEANVLLDVSTLEGMRTSASEKFVVKLHGDDLTLSTVGSKKFFIVLKKKDIRARTNGSFKFMDALFAAELVEAAPVLRALNMTKISLEDEGLTVRMGPVASRENIAFSLMIVKKRTLASDTVLLDRELSMDETRVTSSANAATAIFDINNLGVELTDGKFALTAKAYLKVNGPVLNAAQFGDNLEVSKTLIYTNR